MNPATDKKDVIVFRGPSTSGKSTAAKYMIGYQVIMDILRGKTQVDDVKELLQEITYCTEQQIFAADSFPGLYTPQEGKPPIYDLSKQKSAHAWCKTNLEGAMKAGITPLAVANTNMKLAYLEPFQAMAAQYGYNVHVIHCEGITRADGQPVDNPHGTPQAIIDNQINGFQLLNPPTPGITVQETITGVRHLSDPNRLWCFDLVGTLIKTAPGKRYINHENDLVARHTVLDGMKTAGITNIAIASNQCGIGNGNMSPDIYAGIVKATLEILKGYDIQVSYFVSATHRNQNKALLWQAGELKPITCPERADKPGSGMIRWIIDRTINRNVTYVGDAHQVGHNVDIELVRQFQPVEESLVYMPVEVLEDF